VHGKRAEGFPPPGGVWYGMKKSFFGGNNSFIDFPPSNLTKQFC